MKRVLHVLLIAVLSGIAPAGVSTPIRSFAPVLEAQQDPAKITVYVTRTGEKYHRDGCSSLRRSRIPTSLKDAVERGYGACKLCRPPTVR
jgi:hypothetical protein